LIHDTQAICPRSVPTVCLSISVKGASGLLKKTHMLRCRSIASLQRTVSTPPLVDLSRASPLDLFEQPAKGLFSARC
jgi:hypothetical protein